MTPAQRELLIELCRRITEEKDQATFARLMRELDQLLDEIHGSRPKVN
jgi:hypothetical protein